MVRLGQQGIAFSATLPAYGVSQHRLRRTRMKNGTQDPQDTDENRYINPYEDVPRHLRIAWNCQFCTFHNKNNKFYTACEMCHTKRQNYDSPGERTPWSCSICTFFNDENLNKCKMCGTVKTIADNSKPLDEAKTDSDGASKTEIVTSGATNGQGNSPKGNGEVIDPEETFKNRTYANIKESLDESDEQDEEVDQQQSMEPWSKQQSMEPRSQQPEEKTEVQQQKTEVQKKMELKTIADNSKPLDEAKTDSDGASKTEVLEEQIEHVFWVCRPQQDSLGPQPEGELCDKEKTISEPDSLGPYENDSQLQEEYENDSQLFQCEKFFNRNLIRCQNKIRESRFQNYEKTEDVKLKDFEDDEKLQKEDDFWGMPEPDAYPDGYLQKPWLQGALEGSMSCTGITDEHL